MAFVNRLTQVIKELIPLKPSLLHIMSFLCGLPSGQVIKINNKPVFNCQLRPLMQGLPLNY